MEQLQENAVTFTATYSPEDNKIRLYASERLDTDLYTRVRSAGFIWAPKQELFVAPMWTPERFDLAVELAGFPLRIIAGKTSQGAIVNIGGIRCGQACRFVQFPPRGP